MGFMANYLKIKKRKIVLTFLMIFNQLIFSSYAMNNRRIIISESKELKSSTINSSELKLLISSKKQNEDYLLKKDVVKLERFVEENFDLYYAKIIEILSKVAFNVNFTVTRFLHKIVSRSK